jgi:hypothetical protein
VAILGEISAAEALNKALDDLVDLCQHVRVTMKEKVCILIVGKAMGIL